MRSPLRAGPSDARIPTASMIVDTAATSGALRLSAPRNA